MSRLCWVFVPLVVVVVGASSDDACPHQCLQKGRSLANLELVEDALRKAKLLYPNCGEENENSNCSECSRKEKSLGFIDVALDLVSSDKKNIPICPDVPTEEPLNRTEKHLNATEKPLTATEGSTREVNTEGLRPIDCQDLLDAGHVKSGVYTVWPRGRKSSLRVRCDMDTDGGGWTVIQRRGDFWMQENFNRDWKGYKNGFGNLERDFWIGNDNIFALSNQSAYSLRMDMTAADGEKAYALYREFRIDDEKENYRLSVGGYTGTAGDTMGHSNKRMFSTRDRDNDNWYSSNCADLLSGGFWYSNCAHCNPNGLYMPGVNDQKSVYCFDFKKNVGLSSIDMKIKRLVVETNLQD